MIEHKLMKLAHSGDLSWVSVQMVKHIPYAAQLLMIILKKVKEPVLSDVMKNR